LRHGHAGWGYGQLSNGSDGKIPDCLPTMAGCNYMVRLYRPRSEVLSGTWKISRSAARELTSASCCRRFLRSVERAVQTIRRRRSRAWLPTSSSPRERSLEGRSGRNRSSSIRRVRQATRPPSPRL
jgi:hypothetical protein